MFRPSLSSLQAPSTPSTSSTLLTPSTPTIPVKSYKRKGTYLSRAQERKAKAPTCAAAATCQRQVRTWCPQYFTIPKNTVFYKGLREEIAGSTSELKPARRGYYTIDVSSTISSLSGKAKAQLFGPVHYYISNADLKLTEISDTCWKQLRDEYYACYPRVSTTRCFDDYMCGMLTDGWVNREDFGPMGGFEVYLCQPSTLLTEISEHEAQIMNAKKQKETEESFAQQVRKSLQDEEEILPLDTNTW